LTNLAWPPTQTELKLFFTLNAPFLWALVNAKGEVTESGYAESLDLLPVPQQVSEVIAVAPGEAVTIRRVMLPGKRRSSALAAMPYALEESLGEDVEALHFTLLDWQPGASSTVAIVGREQMRRWIADVETAGIAIDRIIPGYLMLPLHDQSSITLSPIEGSSEIYVRTGQLHGFAIDREYLSYWLEEEDPGDRALSISDQALAREVSELGYGRVSFWEIGNSLPGWLKTGGANTVPDRLSLLHGEFLPSHRARSHRPLLVAAVCGFVAAVAYFGSMYWETTRLKHEQQQLGAEMRTVFSNRFPGEPWLGRPRNQVENLLSSTSGNNDSFQFQQLLNAITGVSRQHRAEIEELNYRDRSLTVLCKVSSLTVLDEIRSAFDALPGVSAELLSSGASDDQVTGRFRLQAG